VTESFHKAPVVLVVDDDPDILEALAEILESEGFVVRRARNGKEALDRLWPDPPQLILLDLMMPVMDGRDFSQHMRRRTEPGVAQIPIIVLSADRSVSPKAKEVGALGYLAKPFELSDLLEMVRGALRQQSLTPPGASTTVPAAVDSQISNPSAERKPMTAKDILETEIPAALKAKPELAKEINAVIHFNVTGTNGGTWTVDLTKASDWVTSGAQGTPKMTITVSDEDFVKIRTKQLNPQMAAMQGKLKFKPMDMGLAMKLGKLLS